jgi:hypothetical protein
VIEFFDVDLSVHYEQNPQCTLIGCTGQSMSAELCSQIIDRPLAEEPEPYGCLGIISHGLITSGNTLSNRLFK